MCKIECNYNELLDMCTDLELCILQHEAKCVHDDDLYRAILVELGRRMKTNLEVRSES